MQNDDEPLKFDLPPLSPPEELTAADLDPHHLAVRVRWLELRVLKLEEQAAREAAAAAKFAEALQDKPGETH